MEKNDALCRFFLVRYNDLVIKLNIPRFEQIQLEWSFLLRLDLFAYEQKPVAAVPGLGFPVALKEGPLFVDSTSPTSFFDHGLELREPFEGNGRGKFHVRTIQHLEDLVAEEGRVDSRLKQCVRELGFGLGKAIQNELLGPIGIMDVAGTMMDIEELTRLSHRTKQGIVASCALFGLVVPNGCSFGIALGGLDGPVEVESQSSQGLSFETFKD